MSHGSGSTRGASGFNGGFVPIAVSSAERLAGGDPRLSLEERYRNHAGYVSVAKDAVRRPEQRRFHLTDDAARLIRRAEESRMLAAGAKEQGSPPLKSAPHHPGRQQAGTLDYCANWISTVPLQG